MLDNMCSELVRLVLKWFVWISIDVNWLMFFILVCSVRLVSVFFLGNFECSFSSVSFIFLVMMG